MEVHRASVTLNVVQHDWNMGVVFGKCDVTEVIMEATSCQLKTQTKRTGHRLLQRRAGKIDFHWATGGC